MVVEYQQPDTGEWITGMIHSRSGKIGGKYHNYWNVQQGDQMIDVNFEAVQWRLPEDVLVNECVSTATSSDEWKIDEVYISQVDEETSAAKEIDTLN